jgi:hypothetical protein
MSKQEIAVDVHGFIERRGTTEIPSTAELFEKLDSGVRHRKIITLVGPSGSGKKTLLSEWARNRTTVARPTEILVVSMSPKPDKSVPPIGIALSRIWDSLEQLARPAYMQPSADARKIRMYTARHIETLRIEVQKALAERNVRAIVIGRADFLNKDGLTWLLDMRNYYDRQRGFKPRFALILSITSDDAQHALLTHIKSNAELRSDWLQFRLSYITPREIGKVLAQIVDLNLNAIFHSSLNINQIAINWYALTGGNWWLLKALAQDIDDKLGTSTDHSPRVITQDVIEHVNARFKL